MLELSCPTLVGDRMLNNRVSHRHRRTPAAIEKEVRRERLLVDRNIRLAEARLAICQFR